MPTHTTSDRRDSDHKKSPIVPILIVLGVIILLVILAFALGWIDVASETAVDTDVPEVDADVDVDADVEEGGDADAEIDGG